MVKPQKNTVDLELKHMGEILAPVLMLNTTFLVKWQWLRVGVRVNLFQPEEVGRLGTAQGEFGG